MDNLDIDEESCNSIHRKRTVKEYEAYLQLIGADKKDYVQIIPLEGVPIDNTFDW